MKLTLYFFIFFACTKLIGQTTNVDSILYIYERNYRLLPDKGDTLFIKNLVEKNQKSKCQYLLESLNGGISYDIITYYIHELVINKVCIDLILDNIQLFKARQALDCSQCVYPIFNELISNSNNDSYVVDYIITSNYLEKCDLLADINKLKYQYLSSIIKKYYDQIVQASVMRGCFYDNLSQLNSTR